MTDTMILPTDRDRRRRRAFIPPLLVVSLLLYNAIVYLFYAGSPNGFEQELFSISMVSGAGWGVTSGDLMATLGLALLFIEVLKSTYSGRSSIVEHMLSTGLFVLFLIEFLLLGAAASSTFFLLTLMSLFDVVAGFSVSITSAGRDVTVD